MTASTQSADHSEIIRLAAEHDLEVDPESLQITDLGLDFRVAIVRVDGGERWVLRIPRRPDVLERAATEGRLLSMIGPKLTVAVPDWQVHSPRLIAYPLLPGEPALTLAADLSPQWHVDMASPTYSASLGEFIAQLHSIDTEQARTTGIDHHEPAAARAQWAQDIDRVADAFDVAPALLERWRAWVAEDSYWPDFSVLTHGEIYPAHTLVDGERVTAVLDWTTAAVGDPARDLQFQHSVSPPEAFEVLLDHYVRGGGRVWPRLGEHCTEMFAASPLGYGLYALETGDPDHREAAEAQLNPPRS